ncbi:MAG TPA: SDR family NAD(P)-dependent oxidoreductase [Actinopolymorphaceae bacterium]
MAMGDFDGRVVVVTGGSTGIGAATVAIIAAAGGSVVYCTHDAATLPPAGTYPDSVVGVVADVASTEAMQGLVDLAVDRFGGLDAVVCSAGIQTYGTVEDTSEDDWLRVLDVNLTGIFRVTKAAIPHLRARGGGSIVTVSSVQGSTPNPRVAGYSTSKAAVDAITRSLAVDFAIDGIRANSVAPGPIDTPLLRVRDETVQRPVTGPAPNAPSGLHGRLGRPAEIGEVIAFLAGPRSTYMTGATVYVDGGMTTTQGRVVFPE